MTRPSSCLSSGVGSSYTGWRICINFPNWPPCIVKWRSNKLSQNSKCAPISCLNTPTNLVNFNTFAPKYSYTFWCYQNCRGLRTKLNTFLCNFFQLPTVFLYVYLRFGTEKMYNNELSLFNYNGFRCDRNIHISNSCRGSGIFIAICKYIISNLIPITKNNLKHLFVNVTLIILSLWLINWVYFPSNSSIPLYESYLSAVHSVLLPISQIRTVCIIYFAGISMFMICSYTT